MRAEVVTDIEQLAALAPRWDELAQCDSRDGFFRTSRWCLSWMRHIRPDAQPFVVVVRNSSGDVVGLAPLCRVTYRDLGFRLQALSWAGREVVSGDFLDFVVEPGCRSEATSAILQFLWAVRSRWSLLIMGELIDGADSERALRCMNESIRLPVHRQEERICPYIALPATFDEYLNTLSSSTRYNIRRRLRNVQKMSAHVDVYTTPREVTDRLDILIRLHLCRWQKQNLPGTLGRPGFAAFLKAVCADPPPGASCRLYLLSDEKSCPVAALLTFCFGQSALYYQAGWDPDSSWASQSPALVLMAHSIRDAIEDGFGYYEFLRGDESYKSHWTSTYRTATTFLFARSLMAREYLRMIRAKDLIKRLVSEMKSRVRGGVHRESN